MRLNCLGFSLRVLLLCKSEWSETQTCGQVFCLATSNELFNVLVLQPLSIGTDLCYSLQDTKSYLLNFYGTPWNHFRLSAGSSSCWSVVTFLCQAPRQRDNSQLTLLALFLQHHGVLPSLKHVPLTHSFPLKAF